MTCTWQVIKIDIKKKLSSSDIEKGRVTIVMKKSDYQGKCEQLLNNEKTYKKLKKYFKKI